MTESASLSGENDPSFSAPVREGEVVAGKYIVGRLLGVGGMGVVFEGRDTGLERRVALKVLLPRLVTSPTAAQRFVNEARAATRITSEHVVKLLEIATLRDSTPLLVMEYLEGKDLRVLLREGGPLEPQVAVDYLLQALQAVAEGHMHGIVHRDLKPGNLFLTERADGTPLIKVLDFGIAKTLESGRPADFRLTSSEDVQLGSPTYMPPEQFRNPRDVDARADIWALGVTLYELISGRVPFQGVTYPELVSQVLSGAPESLKSALAGVSLPAGLAKIVGKCLEKERDKRYLNAVELAVALAPFGSEDARLSLTRVSGLTRPRTPNPASARLPSGAYEATLAVAVDHAYERPHTNTSSGARKVPKVASRRLPWVVIASIAALATWGLLNSQRRPLQQAHAGAMSGAPRPLKTSLAALQVATPIADLAIGLTPPIPAESAKAPAAAQAQGPGQAQALAPGARKREATTAGAAQSKVPAQRSASAAAFFSSGAMTGAPRSSASAAPAAPEASPEDLIESLITRRH